MSRLICSVCSGFHHPEVCPTALRYITQCRMPTPGDMRPLPYFAVTPANVVDLGEHRSVAAERSRMRAERHRRRSWPMSVVT